MEDTSKYLIHAEISADGVVERSDVVGAIFGQTEGLLGDELDLRDLQQSSKVGRIEVEIESASGRSEGTVTIATSVDKVATATLAAALEALDRIGPCRAELEVTDIEDVRAAKRRRIVERAQELLHDSFDDGVMTSEEILDEVRQSARVGTVTDHEGQPAGPRVADSDAVVVVEGRSDVLTLLRYGVKNAVAVEGTNVPDAVADLTADRTVTAFLDGDRGGHLILRELGQVAQIDYVAFAPDGKSVEDLSREEVFAALREKEPHETVADRPNSQDTVATDGSRSPSPPVDENATTAETPVSPETLESPGPDDADTTEPLRRGASDGSAATDANTPESMPDEAEAAETAEEAVSTDALPETLRDHVAEVIDEGRGVVRLLDADHSPLSEAPADEAVDAVDDADPVPTAVIRDGEVTQRLADVAADRGVDRVVGSDRGEFTKRPTSVRVHAAPDIEL
ncbi:DNA primase DnaG [Halostella sp. PRR32]|uniref:DNA primase DnaG n=1 Tax=Halostella sp. PRR32 TaxID=3098147 RepID=UPI002B1D9F49|nr:DNA primase DnaG [Halostella sp. PRR32]